MILSTSAVLLSVALLAGCSTNGADEGTAAVTQDTVQSTTQQASSTGQSAETTVVDSSGGVDWNSLPTTEVSLTDEGLTITDAGTYILSGTTSGQVLVDSDGPVRITLAGATINSGSGAAIQVNNAEVAVLELAEGTENSVSDSATRTDETIDGAIFSSDDLWITGEGSLQVSANFADGIVGKDNLWIESGTISVTAVDDGVRGKDSLTVDGGALVINAAGDGMKASNDTDLGAGILTINAGDITIRSGDDAIKAEQKVWITGGTINIEESVEGIEAPVIVIDGGNITLNASDDGINASASAIITEGLGVTINDGNLTIVMGQGDTDAIDSNGDLTINGGTLNITAQSPFDFDGVGAMNGGTITVNGQQVTELTNQFGGGMGGPGGGGPRG